MYAQLHAAGYTMHNCKEGHVCETKMLHDQT